MCWHYNKQELQLFNLQVLPLRLVHDIRLGLWPLGTFNCNCSCGSSSVLWTLGSMTYLNENFGVYDVFEWERHSCEYLLSRGYSEYPLASLIVRKYLVQTTQPKLEVSSSPKHTIWKLEKTNFRMDAGFEPSTLSIELAIDWHAIPLSQHGLISTVNVWKPDVRISAFFIYVRFVNRLCPDFERSGNWIDLKSGDKVMEPDVR